jgi:sulfoxide reductase heme-binding subunit YedZ
MMTTGIEKQPFMKPVIFGACLIPCMVLAWQAATHHLGANPIDAIADSTGIWTLRLLLITLAVTPARRLTGWNRLIQLRRMLGLFAFFYGSLHFLTYIWLDQFFVVEDIVADVMERPFITVGFTSFILLIPLAVTSTTAMIKRLGGKWWQRLHRLVYATAIGGVVHYLWLVKADTRRPLIYGSILCALFAYRLWSMYGRKIMVSFTMPRKAAVHR